jgi:hypothetical protein
MTRLGKVFQRRFFPTEPSFQRKLESLFLFAVIKAVRFQLSLE